MPKHNQLPAGRQMSDRSKRAVIFCWKTQSKNPIKDTRSEQRAFTRLTKNQTALIWFVKDKFLKFAYGFVFYVHLSFVSLNILPLIID